MQKRTKLAMLFLAAVAAGASDFPFASHPLSYARTEVVSKTSLPVINVGFGQCTLVQLDGDTIARVVGLEKDGPFWKVEMAGTHAVSIKPKQKGINGTLTLVSGHDVLLAIDVQEVSRVKPEPPYDVEVFLTPDDALAQQMTGPEKLFTADDLEQYKRQASQAEQAATQAREEAAKKVAAEEAAYREQYARSIRHYRWNQRAGDKLGIEDIWADDRHTKIRIRPLTKASAVYELVKGKRVDTAAPLDQGIYTIDKVLRQGAVERDGKRVVFSLIGAE